MMIIKQKLISISEKIIKIFIPLSYRLTVRYFLYYYFWGMEEKEIYLLSKRSYDNGTAIDIGANLGLYSYCMSKIFKNVVAFEINELIAKELIAAKMKNVIVHTVGLSSADCIKTLLIPQLNSVELDGWASVEKDHFKSDNFIKKEVQCYKLDNYNLKNVKYIKIDVEGHEIEVLKGALETLKANSPLLQIEISKKDFREVLDFLGPLNFKLTKKVTLENTPFDNCFFIKEEPL